jgi:signal transduction histidine kinase
VTAAIWKRDLAVGLVVTTVAEIELVLSRDSIDGSFTGLLLSNLLILPALVVRRTQPLASIAVAAFSFLVDPLVGSAPVATPFLVLLGLLVSLGWYAGTRAGVLGVSTVLVVGLLPSSVTGETHAADLVVNAALLVVAWAGGHALRRTSDRRIAAEVEADRAARHAVAVERERIARDLHDSMAHALTLITLQAGSAGERATDDATRELLGAIETTGREALADMHRFLALVGHGDDEAPGVTSLPGLVEGVQRSGLDVDLDVDIARELPASLSTTVYRVVQEALTNVARHSEATRARVGVACDDHRLVVRVSDDGQPRPGRTDGTGRGLAGLRERVALFDGEVVSGPRGGGWCLEASIPLGER